jgi:acetolactate synthase-1/2/3 large subunit
MIAGLDALRPPGDAAVASFCRRFRVPLITTYKAKGLLPEDDALALGGAGLSPRADAVLLRAVRRADLILLAGYDPIEMRVGWREPWDPATQHVVEIAAAANDHYMHHASVSFVADVASGLEVLGRNVAARATWGGGEPAAVKAELAQAFGQGEAWGPAAIVEEVRAAAPRNAIATVDSGAHRILLSQVWEAYEPRTLLQSTGFCTMGCALPLAIGAKLADPARPVIAFSGDAGLEMVLGELATLRDLELPLVVVVFVDASLALIELKQRGSGLANVGVDFGETDFAALARAFGGQGAVCGSRAELRTAMAAALAAPTFTVVACRIARQSYDGRL